MTYNLDDLIEALYGEQVQELENSGFDLFSRLDIDAMEGEQLKKLARLVGQTIISDDDETLKVFIKGKIGQNSSKGTFDDVFSILLLITKSNTALVRELYPASIEFEIDGTIEAGLEQAVLDFMQKSVAAGVKVDAIRTDYRESGWFRFGTNGTSIYNNSGFNQGKFGTSIIRST